MKNRVTHIEFAYANTHISLKHTLCQQKVLSEPVTACLIDRTSDVTVHVGIWDRPKRATGGSGSSGVASGGAYMTDPAHHLVQPRSVKVSSGQIMAGRVTSQYMLAYGTVKRATGGSGSSGVAIGL